MSHAQPQAHVELGSLPVQELRLGDGVAHGLVGAGAHPELLGHPRLVLGDGARLADDGDHLKAVFPENPVHHGGLLVEPGAEGQPQLGVAHAAGELHHLPQAGPLSVADGLHGGAGHEEVVVLRFEILLQDLLKEGRVVHGTVFGHLVQLPGPAGLDGALGAGEHGNPSSSELEWSRAVTPGPGWPDRRRGRSRTNLPRGSPG